VALDAETKFTVGEIAEAAVQGHLAAQDKYLEAKLEAIEATVAGGIKNLDTKIKLWGIAILAGQIIVGLTALGVSHLTNTPMVEIGRTALHSATGLIL
jgi:hypothetical protein